MTEIGALIREHRKCRGMTLKMLGQASGFSITALSDIERGRQAPSLKTLFKICAALHVNPCDVIAPEYVTMTRKEGYQAGYRKGYAYGTNDTIGAVLA